jgi:hypothetical protein
MGKKITGIYKGIDYEIWEVADGIWEYDLPLFSHEPQVMVLGCTRDDAIGYCKDTIDNIKSSNYL